MAGRRRIRKDAPQACVDRRALAVIGLRVFGGSRKGQLWFDAVMLGASHVNREHAGATGD